MEDMLGFVLALAVTAIAGVGAYVYWERKKASVAAEGARRRLERKHLVESREMPMAVPPIARNPGFGRR